MKGVTPIAHFHDTRGTGLVNYVAAYEAGVRHFDSSFGGVGGHPAKVKYGGGLTGNVCTEDLVNLFESMGIATGIDLDGLLATAEFCEQALGRELHGRVTRSGLSPLIRCLSFVHVHSMRLATGEEALVARVVTQEGKRRLRLQLPARRHRGAAHGAVRGGPLAQRPQVTPVIAHPWETAWQAREPVPWQIEPAFSRLEWLP